MAVAPAGYHNPPRNHFRSRTIFVIAGFFFATFFLVFSPLPGHYREDRDALVHHLSEHVSDTARDSIFDHLSSFTGSEQAVKVEPIYKDDMRNKHAFATFLAGHDGDLTYEEDHYFVAARILAYQLLHAKETRSRDREVPFIVLVTDKVPEWQQIRLRKDGAVVVQVPHITSPWAKPGSPAWTDVFTKLRLWELVQFDLVCFLDVDHQLQEPLDGIFSDQAVAAQTNLGNASQIAGDEAAQPSSFVLASVPEMMHEHHYPPTEEAHDFPNINYLNAGFFVLKPSLETLNYYLSVLKIEGRFDSALMEQNLMNYAHRRDGNMPWTQLGTEWNIHYPSMDDIKGGVRSLHEKWWTPEHEELRPMMESWRWKMEGFFEARDQMRFG